MSVLTSLVIDLQSFSTIDCILTHLASCKSSYMKGLLYLTWGFLECSYVSSDISAELLHSGPYS